MKHIKHHTSIFFIAVITIFQSCTIEKRHHLSGYHIDWKLNNRHTNIVHSEQTDLASSESSENQNSSDYIPVTQSQLPLQEIVEEIVCTNQPTISVEKKHSTEEVEEKTRAKAPQRIWAKSEMVEGNRMPINDEITENKTDGLAIAGFVLALVGLLILAIPMGILAVIFCGIALGRINREGRKGKGLAIAGLIIGLVDIIVGIYIVSSL